MPHFTIERPDASAERQYPLGDHPVLFTEIVLGCIGWCLLDGQRYSVTGIGCVLLGLDILAMLVLAVQVLRRRYPGLPRRARALTAPTEDPPA